MKLIALCSIQTKAGRHRPGDEFEAAGDDGANLIKRGFAAESKGGKPADTGDGKTEKIDNPAAPAKAKPAAVKEDGK